MSSQAFPYSPLSEPDAFRILHLQPSPDRSAPVHCTLEHSNLSKYDFDILDPYTALSYVWGDASDQRIIRVDGEPFAVTKNLHDALKCLRDNKKILSIWADAICIDQLDVLERNIQVTQMGRIYSCATHTIIFLDSSSHDLDFIIQESGDIPEKSTELSDALINKFRDLLSHFGRIMSRPWFNRVWILQELVLSKDPFVQCATTRIRWNTFSKIGNALEGLQRDLTMVDATSRNFHNASGFQSTPKDSPDHITLQVLNDMSKARNSHYLEMSNARHYWDVSVSEGFLGNKLSDLVERRRGCGASDPRDIIYAQIGLVSKQLGSDSGILEVDYSKSVGRIYAEMTCHMLKEGRDTFEMLECRDAAKNQLILSSWVPNWSRTMTPTLNSMYHSNQPHNAGRFPTPRLVSIQDEKQALLLNVKLAAEIIQVSRVTDGVAETALDLWEKQSFDDYFQPEMRPEELQGLFDRWLKSGPGMEDIGDDIFEALGTGFERMLLAWVSSLGLPNETLIPLDDVQNIINIIRKGYFSQLWKFKPFSEIPFFLYAVHNYLIISRGYQTRTSFPVRFYSLGSGRLCTVKCACPREGNETTFQIIPVPEAAQIGDVIANIDQWDTQNLLVIRPLKLSWPEFDEWPPTYEVVGTCQFRTTIKGTDGLEGLPDVITLV